MSQDLKGMCCVIIINLWDSHQEADMIQNAQIVSCCLQKFKWQRTKCWNWKLLCLSPPFSFPSSLLALSLLFAFEVGDSCWRWVLREGSECNGLEGTEVWVSSKPWVGAQAAREVARECVRVYMCTHVHVCACTRSLKSGVSYVGMTRRNRHRDIPCASVLTLSVLQSWLFINFWLLESASCLSSG